MIAEAAATAPRIFFRLLIVSPSNAFFHHPIGIVWMSIKHQALERQRRCEMAYTGILQTIVIARSDLSAVAQRAKAEATKQSIFAAPWIASRSLSSGAHSRDPLARNDG